MKHIEKQSSDHCMLVLDTIQNEGRKRRRFSFDKRWISKPGVEDIIRNAWTPDCFGSPIHQVASKIKRCRLALLNWSRQGQSNSAVRIQKLKAEMEELRGQEGQRDWDRWYRIKEQLDNAYIDEELFWSQKARVQWLQEGDKNT